MMVNTRSMKFGKAVNSVLGLIAIVLAAVILADGVLALMGLDIEFLSLPAFKVAVGFIALLLAGTIFDNDI